MKKDNTQAAIAAIVPRLRNIAEEFNALAADLEKLIEGPVASGDGNPPPGGGG